MQRKVRVRSTANLILFVVDASWSMAASERMQATKGAILSLLTDAYQRRDRVGLIVFRGKQASMVLPPTSSVQLAKRVLQDIPIGGKTPLSAGLILALDTIKREKALHPDVVPLMILLTDGAGNVPVSQLPPLEESNRLAEQFKRGHIKTVTIYLEYEGFDQDLASNLAERMGGPCYSMTQIRADNLYQTVRHEMNLAAG
ncbi:MAG: VWA domain-containing protein [Sterolibacterium sp.]